MTGQLPLGIDELLERALTPPGSVRELTLLVRDFAAQLRGAVAAFNFVEGERVKALADADAARLLADKPIDVLTASTEWRDEGIRRLQAKVEQLRKESGLLFEQCEAARKERDEARAELAAARHEAGVLRTERDMFAEARNKLLAELEVATAANAVAAEVAEDCVAITAAVVRDPGMFDVDEPVERPPPAPTAGRIVHVWLSDIGPYPAIVVDAWKVDEDHRIDAVVFGGDTKEPARFVSSLHPNGSREQDGWCWPPRDGGGR